MIQRGKNFSHKALRFFLIAALVLAISGTSTRVRAAAVTDFSDALSTIEENANADHTITFTIADDWSSTETLSIDLPDTFDTTAFDNNDEEDFDITDDGAEQALVDTATGCGAPALEILLTTVNTSTNTITFTRCTGDATIASGSVIVIEIGLNATNGGSGNDQIQNQSATENDSDALVTLGGDFGGSGTLALEIVADNTYSLSATVDPQITCSIDQTSGAFGTFVLSTVDTASNPPTWTISTNAANGYSLTARSLGSGAAAGLYSAGASYTIASATEDLAAANEIGYGLQGSVTTNGGAGSATSSISAPYTASGTNVGALQLTDQTLASASGAVSGAQILSTYKAVVSGLVPAGSYNDTVTYVCTGIY